MSKNNTKKYLWGLSLLMALGFGKPGKAQTEENNIKEKKPDLKEIIYIEPQISSHFLPDDAIDTELLGYDVKPESSKFKVKESAKISVNMPFDYDYWDRSGLVSTILLHNFSTIKRDGPLIYFNDLYLYTNIKLNENKNIGLKLGKFHQFNYWDHVSNYVPISTDYLSKFKLNSEYRLPWAATATFQDENYSVGIGAGVEDIEFVQMGWIRQIHIKRFVNQWYADWTARCNIIVSGEYKNKFFKIGAVLMYNVWNKEGSPLKDVDKISGNLQLMVTPNDKHSVVLEVNNYRYNYVFSGHLMYSWEFAPNMRVSCDVCKQMQKGGGFTLDGAAISLWYTKLGAYGCLGVGPRPNSMLFYPEKHKNYSYVEIGAKIPLSNLLQKVH